MRTSALKFGKLTLAALSAVLTLQAATLEEDFLNPPVSARPYVWWHWMGPNFSQSGITKDLEAMAASGIGGATIFNLTSAVQESQAPTLNNPWPENTYRGPAYWAALRHAADEAKRLGLEIGLHNTVGYSTTGGPWISEEQGMQRLLWSETAAKGGQSIALALPAPAIPPYKGWGATGGTLSFRRDVAVLAVPVRTEADSKISASEILDLSAFAKPVGDALELRWDAPPGDWTIYRFIHAPTGASPHPVPDDVLGRTLEADKMSLAQTRHHWTNVLDPLRENLGSRIGDSFRHVLIDSYEAGPQSWTPGFREEFLKRKGYDPLPWLVTLGAPITGNNKQPRVRVLGTESDTARFEWDYRDVVASLYQENGWAPAAKLAHDAGLKLQFEPYSGPFDSVAATTVADLPMIEFWTGSEGGGWQNVIGAARAAGRHLVGAEALTGRPEVSRWTETPAFLKRSVDGAFANGVNRMILHHWVHQPFDDRYQPGMGMGWWGTHFSRHQTWAEPGKAFYQYLGRVQALLQQGETPVRFVSVGRPGGGDVIPRSIFLAGVSVENGEIVLPSGRRYAFLHVPHDGALLPEELREIKRLLNLGTQIVARAPSASPSLAGQPEADAQVRAIAAELWAQETNAVRRFGSGVLYTHGKPELAMESLRLAPYFQVQGEAAKSIRVHHRRTDTADLFFLANLSDRSSDVRFSALVKDRQPELWNPETAEIGQAPAWSSSKDRTEVSISLGANKTVFVVFRQPPATNAASLTGFETDADRSAWFLASDDQGRAVLRASTALSGTARFSNGKTKVVSVPAPPAPTEIQGPWAVALRPKLGVAAELTLEKLVSLSERPEADAKYFSGTATYRRTFELSSDLLTPGRRLRLDLGAVRDLARVTLNGSDLGVLWHPPYSLDVTAAIRTGQNVLEVAVTNTWHNRLVGDEQHPADFEFGRDRGVQAGRALKGYPDWFLQNTPRPSSGRMAFVNWFYHRADTPLLPSGLLGPVRLVRLVETKLAP